ncbi:hypothetical protein ACEWY4_015506 [Coilia grayii]|uniref:Ig-like domain-containing protein n=1 Tax=Coilia grayii TaxID=363190 RepID=A0ABD1JNB6_9TELE
MQEPVSPGGLETLECVVLTESRTEELSVFWFRPASGASHPGLIYINKSSSGQCEGSCVYSLLKTDVNITDAGTYYCAIATSGHILFGNGTTLRFDPVETKIIFHPTLMMTAKMGSTVTLTCFVSQKETDAVVWYKQSIGQIPRIAGVTHRFVSLLYNEFNTTRFNLHKGSGSFNLSISNIQLSDEASYFCGVNIGFDIHFRNGTFLLVKEMSHEGTNIAAVIQDPVPGPVSPGGSETLQCVVLTESRTEELSVFWFRPASGASHPGLIYINKSSSGHCEGRCVYSLLKKDVNITDAGTYYCAIATSGHVLFGNGTSLRLTEPVNTVLFGLVVALGCGCVVLACCLAWLICRGRAGACRSKCDISPINVLNYAALSFPKKESRGRRTRREPPPDAVYAAVRL